MFELENRDIEEISKSQSIEGEGLSSISQCEKDYVQEVIPLKDPELLIARIDEVAGYVPPRAVDSNPDVAKIIEGQSLEINKQYLEAPTDLEQMSESLEMLQEHDISNPEKWNAASIEGKIEMVQDAEIKLAEIEHRPPVPVHINDQMGKVVKRGDFLFGSFGVYNPATKDITLNFDLLKSKDSAFQEKVINTLIHEGRHAYQDYNSHFRTVHTDREMVIDWEYNLRPGNYKSCPPFDFETYWNQPVEKDARAFADPITNELFQHA